MSLIEKNNSFFLHINQFLLFLGGLFIDGKMGKNIFKSNWKGKLRVVVYNLQRYWKNL